jgi:hypothetical protein
MQKKLQKKELNRLPTTMEERGNPIERSTLTHIADQFTKPYCKSTKTMAKKKKKKNACMENFGLVIHMHVQR